MYKSYSRTEPTDSYHIIMVKRIRQEGQPRRPVSGFIRFMNNNRARYNLSLDQENVQGSRVVHVSRLAKLEWHAMDDAGRDVWNDPAREEITRYNEEMAKWNAENPTPVPVQEPKKPKKVKKERPPGTVKKTTTSYILYYINERTNTMAELNSEGAEITFTTITRRTASKWKALTPELRAPWDEKAAALVEIAKAEAAKELEEHTAKVAEQATAAPADETVPVVDVPTEAPPKPKRKYTRKPKVVEPVVEAVADAAPTVDATGATVVEVTDAPVIDAPVTDAPVTPKTKKPRVAKKN
ncbi:hypothetical protein EhV18_00487 [Emiliania huxleyi virus 18]|nr:hypothetical protein EhV18_00487 [Emiliania huxleyi virus 18]AHA55573.1 hypothetical protein EhV156_00478 [Emiliania huxleyi virus 156]